MKRAIKYVLGFALLGVLIGACFPLFLEPRGAGTYGLPWWLEDYLSPTLAPLVITIPAGLFLGALTGLASAFSTGRFATVRCLLMITGPAIVAMSFVVPRCVKNMRAPPWPMWTAHLAFAAVAVAMTVLLVYLGRRETRSASGTAPPTPHSQ